MERAFRDLDRAFEQSPEVNLETLGKAIIFSDIHMGDGKEGADDFLPNRELLEHALKEYLRENYFLILLGDVEELWECCLEEVFEAYGRIYELFMKFHEKNTFIRIVGNHDIFLSEKRYFKSVRRIKEEIFSLFADPFPGLKIKKDDMIIFLTHGHQIDFFSSRIWKLSRFAVRYLWRPIQLLLKVSTTSPARNYRKRNRFERIYFQWAKSRGVIFIAGHTHRPMFESLSKVDRLKQTLKYLEKEMAASEEILRLRKVIEEKERQEGRAPQLENLPFYFNTGCCIFPDHVITGVELDQEYMRLVGFKKKENKVVKTLYEEANLKEIFGKVKISIL